MHFQSPPFCTCAVKTQGTNCAFRRDDLLAVRGFDEGYRFYLDESDVNLRLAARGGLTAVVPDAVVHHGFLASARRRIDRVPTDLTEIGASTKHFLLRHAPNDSQAVDRQAADQRHRLLRLMVTGALEPRDVRRLMKTFHSGLAAGADRTAPLIPILPTPLPFIALPGTGPRQGHIVAGRARDRDALDVEARTAVAKGKIVTVLCLSRGIRPHRLRFVSDGYWLQTGGRSGRSARDGPRVAASRVTTRIAAEVARLSRFRPV